MDIAEDIDKDISTVSRVTNGKYVQLPWEIKELKTIFSDGILTDSSLSLESISPLYQGNADADAILNEAHNVIERKTKTSMPEPPTTSSQYFSKEKAS